jgi:hypothetical protein
MSLGMTGNHKTTDDTTLSHVLKELSQTEKLILTLGNNTYLVCMQFDNFQDAIDPGHKLEHYVQANIPHPYRNDLLHLIGELI